MDCQHLDVHSHEVVVLVDLVVHALGVLEDLVQEVLVDLQESQIVESHLAHCHLVDHDLVGLVVGLVGHWGHLVVLQRVIVETEVETAMVDGHLEGVSACPSSELEMVPC